MRRPAPSSTGRPVRPGITLAGTTIEFEVTVDGTNLDAPLTGAGTIEVEDASGREDAGDVLRDALRIAIMGDSFSAGEGAGDYISGSDTSNNTCHRSGGTYLMENFELEDAWNLACSGALAADITSVSHSNSSVQPQVKQLADLQNDAPMDAVVLTIGGNDAGFATILGSCLVSPIACDKRVLDTNTTEYLDRHLNGLASQLTAQYEAIDQELNSRATVSTRGFRAPIVVLAYPRLFPGAKGSCAPLTTFTQAELDTGSALVTRLNGTVEGAVAAARTVGVPALFVPQTEDAFVPDHSICDGEKSYVRDPASIQLGPNSDTLDTVLVAAGPFPGAALQSLAPAASDAKRRIQELFHPNDAGYDAMTRAIIRWSLTDDANVGPPKKVPSPSNGVDDVRASNIALRPTNGIAKVSAGARHPVAVSGFAPGTVAEITMSSELRVLGVPIVDLDGKVSATVRIPTDLEAGRHTISVAGLAPDGTPRTAMIPVEIVGSWWQRWRFLALLLPALLLLVGLALRGRRRGPQLRKPPTAHS